MPTQPANPVTNSPSHIVFRPCVRRWSALTAGLIAMLLPAAAVTAEPAPTVLLDYGTSGSKLSNKGSLGAEGDLTVEPDSRSRNAGSAEEEFLFDGSQSDVKSENPAGPRAISGSAGLPPLVSFTICGWVLAHSLPNNAYLFCFGRSSGPDGDFIGWKFVGSSRMVLSVAGSHANSPATADLTFTGQWLFLAAAFDGTSRQVTYYVGSKSEPIREIGRTGAVYHADYAGGSSPISVGNVNNAFSAPFPGIIARLQLIGSQTGADGALGAPQLDELRESTAP